MFSLPITAESSAEGLTELRPIVLEGTKLVDFEWLLSVFYPKKLGRPDARTVGDWTSILNLSTKWEFVSLRKEAVYQLSRTASPIDLLVLSHMFNVAEWRIPAYESISRRSTLLTTEEASRLPVDDVTIIYALRQYITTDSKKFRAFLKTLEPSKTELQSYEDTVVLTSYPKPSTMTSTSYSRHERFYLADGNVVFLVEDKLYNIHRYFLEQYWATFASKFLSSPAAASTDGHPIYLQGVKSSEFCRLLCLFYPKNLGEFEPQTTDELESIMRLTSRCKLTSHVDLDINRFPLITSPVDRLVVAYGLHVTGWLRPAFVALCLRDEPLTIEEGRRLGINVIVCINEVRDLIKKFLDPQYVNLCMREEPPTLEECDRLYPVAKSIFDIFKVRDLITKGTLLKSREGIAGALEWFFRGSDL